MPNIPFPNVPAYAGVPLLPRQVGIPTTVTFALGLTQEILTNSVQQASEWGIFDSAGNQLGVSSQNSGIGAALLSLVKSSGPTLSTDSLEFSKETRISDFPVEAGSFASYNKVEMPGNPVVTLALAGNEQARSAFLSAIDDACTSTDLFSVVTPEFTYIDYSVERYSYSRRQTRGATLLVVEISLKEIRQVSAAYTKVATPIQQPKAVDATPQTNSGLVQPVDTSTLKSLTTSLKTLFPAGVF